MGSAASATAAAVKETSVEDIAKALKELPAEDLNKLKTAIEAPQEEKKEEAPKEEAPKRLTVRVQNLGGEVLTFEMDPQMTISDLRASIVAHPEMRGLQPLTRIVLALREKVLEDNAAQLVACAVAGSEELDLAMTLAQFDLKGSYSVELGVMRSQVEWLGDEEAAAINNSNNEMKHEDVWKATLEVDDGETWTLDIETCGRPGLKYGPRYPGKQHRCKVTLCRTTIVSEFTFSMESKDAPEDFNKFVKAAGLKLDGDNALTLTYVNPYNGSGHEASLRPI